MYSLKISKKKSWEVNKKEKLFQYKENKGKRNKVEFSRGQVGRTSRHRAEVVHTGRCSQQEWWVVHPGRCSQQEWSTLAGTVNSHVDRKCCLSIFLSHWMQGWGGGSVGKVLATQSWRPELGSTMPSKKPGMVVYAYNPTTGDTETGGFLKLTGQPT